MVKDIILAKRHVDGCITVSNITQAQYLLGYSGDIMLIIVLKDVNGQYKAFEIK